MKWNFVTASISRLTNQEASPSFEELGSSEAAAGFPAINGFGWVQSPNIDLGQDYDNMSGYFDRIGMSTSKKSEDLNYVLFVFNSSSWSGILLLRQFPGWHTKEASPSFEELGSSEAAAGFPAINGFGRVQTPNIDPGQDYDNMSGYFDRIGMSTSKKSEDLNYVLFVFNSSSWSGILLLRQFPGWQTKEASPSFEELCAFWPWASLAFSISSSSILWPECPKNGCFMSRWNSMIFVWTAGTMSR